LCVVCEFVGKKLQSDVATELQVFCLVHHSHTLRHVLSTIFKPKRLFAERLWVFSKIAQLLNQS
jgi:hypothetical protein